MGPVRLGNQLRRANSTLDRCGIEVQLRDNKINFFNAGTLFDLEVNDFGPGPGQVTCLTAGLSRTAAHPVLATKVAHRRHFSKKGGIGFDPRRPHQSVRGAWC